MSRAKQRAEALRKRLEGEMLEAAEEVYTYLENSVGIGEHPQLAEALEDRIGVYAEKREKLEAIDEFIETL